MAELLKTRVIDMTGEELLSLVRTQQQQQPPSQIPPLVYGIDGLARLLNVSTATAMRMKKSGIFDPAISQAERTIVIRTDIALDVLHKEYQKKIAEQQEQ